MWRRDPASPLPFLALEGCDGAGKSTIRDILAGLLRERGIRTTVVGQHAWLDPWTARLIVEVREQRRSHRPRAIAEAYFLDKVLHARRNVLPACAAGSLVISDRYVLSDAVYLEALYGIPAEETLQRHRATGTAMPAAFVHVTLDVEEAVRRIARRSRHVQHYERPADLRRIVQVYDRLLAGRPLGWLPPCVTFDNTGGDVRRRVREDLLPRLLALLGIASFRGAYGPAEREVAGG